MDYLLDLMQTANDRLDLAKKGMIGMSMLALLTCAMGIYNVYQIDVLARKDKTVSATQTEKANLQQTQTQTQSSSFFPLVHSTPPTTNVHPWLRIEQKLDRILELLHQPRVPCSSMLPEYLVLQKPEDKGVWRALTPTAPRTKSLDDLDATTTTTPKEGITRGESEVTIYDEKPIEEILENYQDMLVGLPLMPHMLGAHTVDALNYDLRLDLPDSSSTSAGKEEESGEDEEDGSADELSNECYDNIPCSNHKKLTTLQRFTWF